LLLAGEAPTKSVSISKDDGDSRVCSHIAAEQLPHNPRIQQGAVMAKSAAKQETQVTPIAAAKRRKKAGC